MLKRTSKVLYNFEGDYLNVMQIYSKLRKRRGLAKILASANISFKDGLRANIVFVRNRNIKNVSAHGTEFFRIYLAPLLEKV